MSCRYEVLKAKRMRDQTFLRPTVPNMPCGRTASTIRRTTYAATS